MTRQNQTTDEQPLSANRRPFANFRIQPFRTGGGLSHHASRAARSVTQHRYRWWFAGVSAFVVSVGLGLTLTALHGNFALGQTTLAGVSTKQPPAALREQLNQRAAAYRFTVTVPGGNSHTYSLADAGITVDAAGSQAAAVQTTRDLGWQRFNWRHSAATPLVLHKNRQHYNAFLQQHVTIANQSAKDASISADSGSAIITPAVDGWTYAVPGGNQTITSAASQLQPLRAVLAKTTVKPTLSASDLKSAETKITTYTSHNVSFIMDGQTIAATPKNIASWLDIEAVPRKHTADVSVNSGKLQAYLEKATKSFVAPPRSQINTTDANGAVTVLSPGQNGSTITNLKDVVTSVSNQLQGDTPDIAANLSVEHQQFGIVNAADYPKWIVADLTAKRMYAYEHNQLVRTFLISAGAPKTPTVVGTYQIYSKVPVKTMKGANADGSRYSQPNVKYVNYFYKDYAIHGNYWRPASYFGNINSSHGCLGITDSDAAWIYGWAPIGTTVITHT